jgi:hypothetical protein
MRTDVRRQRIGGEEVAGDRHVAVPAACTLERLRVRGATRDPDRDARLDRSRPHRRLGGEVRAGVGDGAREQPGEDVEGLVGDRRPDGVRRLVAEVGEVQVGRVAEADAERHPPAAEVVEGDQVLGHDGRPSARERRDHRADPEARGRGRDGAQQHPRVVHLDPVVPPQVVPEEEPVPAVGLGRTGPPHDGAGIGERRDAETEAHPATLEESADTSSRPERRLCFRS